MAFSFAILAAAALAATPGDAAIHADAAQVVNRTTRLMYGSCIEDVNHEIYGGLYAQQIFGESFEEPPRLAVEAGGKRGADAAAPPHVSGMWDAVHTCTATARYAWDDKASFNSAHSQKIELLAGEGTVGVVNRGLNRWGLSVLKDHVYDGRLYLRQEDYDGKATVALQSADGARTYAKQEIGPVGKDWERYDFSLKATAEDADARFAVWIDKPGAGLGGVRPPSERDRRQAVPRPAGARRTLANALGRGRNRSVLRYGGCMVNAPEYRWKKMIGDRDRRPQYKGWWYPYSTNGFGIEDFLQFCRAAGFESVFAINDEETPEDAADLVEYLNGPATSTWGKRRAANGHPESYGVRYIEIGNEEKTDAHYIERFKLLSEAMHARDPDVQLIIAAWWEPDNPAVQADRGAGGWTARQQLGRSRRRRRPAGRRQSGSSFHAHGKAGPGEWAPGTKLKACVLEENGGRHKTCAAPSATPTS